MKDYRIEKNALINVINRIITMTLSLLTLIVVTKRIGNENYGMTVFCDSIVAYFWLLSSLGISDYAIRECAPIREDKAKVNNLINRLFSFNVITSLITFSLLFILIGFVNFSNIEKTVLFIYGIRVLFSAFDLSWAYKIFEDYLFIAICRTIVEVMFFLISYFFIHTPEDFMIFVIASSGLEILSYFIELFGLSKYIKLHWTSKINIKEFIRPVMVIFASMATITIYNNSDLTMLGFLRSNYEVGLYKISSKVFMVVLELINSICIVALPRISYYVRNNKKESYNKLSNRAINTVILLTIPAIVGIMLVSDNAIPLIFGQEYIGSVGVLKIMSFALFFGALENVFMNIILISNKKENVIFKITAASALINIILNALTIPQFGMYGAAISTLVSEIFVFVCSFISCKNIFRIGNIKNSILTVVIMCIIIICICKLITLLEVKSVIELVLQIVLSIVSYFVILYLCKNKKIL